MLGDLKQFSNEILVLLSAGLIWIVIILLRNYFKHVNGKIDRVLNKVDWLMIEQESTDYALDLSFKNGYSKYKAEKKEELIKKYEEINKERKV